MEKEITREVYETVRKVHIMDDIYCDICKKRIGKLNGKNYKQEQLFEQHYFRVVTGHHDWGNDSCDSLQAFDLCSEICLCDYFDNQYLNDCKNSNTQYLNIEQVNKSTTIPDDIAEKIANGEEIE